MPAGSAGIQCNNFSGISLLERRRGGLAPLRDEPKSFIARGSAENQAEEALVITAIFTRSARAASSMTGGWGVAKKGVVNAARLREEVLEQGGIKRTGRVNFPIRGCRGF